MSNTPSSVRIAGPDDRQEIWRMFLQSHRENGQFALDPEKVDWLLHRALYPQMIAPSDFGPRPVVGVIGAVGALEALALMAVDTYWYTNEKHLGEYLVYVDPECRHSGHAKAIIQWMKRQSDITGLPLLTGIISNQRTDAKVRLYRRMLPPIGAFFMYRGKSSSAAA
jgi:GNAT superfamily N-acetyltransferase